MAEDELDIDLDDLARRMDGALAALRTEFASLRTGRASASMLEPVMVDAYGQMTPINQVGTVNVPEPRMVTVNVWDKGLVGKVEKAIRESGLGINPQLNGTIIMLPIPELNEERRRELTKVAAQYAEHARVAVRNVRRDGMDQIKKAKTKGMSEDDVKLWEEEVQELTNGHIAKVDAALETKQAEIMQVLSNGPQRGHFQLVSFVSHCQDCRKCPRNPPDPNMSPSLWMGMDVGPKCAAGPGCSAMQRARVGSRKSCAPVPIWVCAT